MNILLIDNYDSFTFNLVHYLEDLGARVTVKRNDEIDLNLLDDQDALVVSPGPGIPREAGSMYALLGQIISDKRFERLPILGICLGHQALIELFGGKILNLDKVYHGVATDMHVEKATPIFQNIPQEFQAGRYHSWCADEASFPDKLIVNCRDTNGQIMGFQHNTKPIYGLQFHPESIMTPDGKTMLRNFMQTLSKDK
jgi:anthranilate synthase component 2